MDSFQRRKEYGCDITYGTNNEFGFDYLRDNMVVDKADLVQREYFMRSSTKSIPSSSTRPDSTDHQAVPPRAKTTIHEMKSPLSGSLRPAEFRLENRRDAEKLVADGKEQEAGVLLLRAFHGSEAPEADEAHVGSVEQKARPANGKRIHARPEPPYERNRRRALPTLSTRKPPDQPHRKGARIPDPIVGGQGLLRPSRSRDEQASSKTTRRSRRRMCSAGKMRSTLLFRTE